MRYLPLERSHPARIPRWESQGIGTNFFQKGIPMKNLMLAFSLFAALSIPLQGIASDSQQVMYLKSKLDLALRKAAENSGKSQLRYCYFMGRAVAITEEIEPLIGNHIETLASSWSILTKDARTSEIRSNEALFGTYSKIRSFAVASCIE